MPSPTHHVISPNARLLHYLSRHRGAFVLGFICAVVTTCLSLLAPWVLRYAIDDLRADVTLPKVRAYAATLLLLAAVGGVFRFLMRRIIIGASRDFEYDLRNDFFAHLQRLDLAFFHRNRTGDLMSRATSDLNAVRSMIGPAVMYSATTSLTFIIGIVLMMSINARLALLSLLPLPFVSIIVRYFGAAIHHRFERIQAQLSDISAITQESLAGVRVIRAYGQEPFEIERFRQANEDYVTRNRALIRLQGMYYPSMSLLMGVAALLVLWRGSADVIAGRMSVGELVAFNSYLMMLAWPMIAFGWVTNLIQRGMASWKRLLEVLDTQPAIADGTADLVDIAEVRGDIEFRHLTFAFGDPVLQDVSAHIPAGTTAAIIGPTGSGKSTLLALLARLHDAPAGTIFIDGVDVRRIPLAALRGLIGFVPQEPFLFGATIAENIAFGARGEQTSRSHVERAAVTSRLDKDVATLPNGYDTIVGERGITLSGGQKQRAALARALITNPRILILDDAMSAVDIYTEEEILTNLAGVMRQRTTLIVSHRVSTVRGAQQILVLDAGRIVERGTHAELLRLDGIYAALYRKQLLEDELAAS